MALDENYPLALPKGTVLGGQYVIERVLGQGGFGITYQAVDHKTGKNVAVKEFFPDSMAARTTATMVSAFSGARGESFLYGKGCFLKEAETLAQFIGNEHIVRVFSYFEENGTAYFVMEYIEGTSFDQYIKSRGGKLPYEEAEKILLPIIDALAAVHAKGIVHRDVTPDNIYITKDGTVKLLDFGAARYSLGDKSRSLDVVLKHGFAPKEQYTRHGRQGPYTDVYTLGASFYFAITGRRLPDSIDRIDEDEMIPPSSLGKIAPEKEDVLLKAMSVQPSNRYQTMVDFREALMREPAGAQEYLAVQQGVERNIVERQDGGQPAYVPQQNVPMPQPEVLQPVQQRVFTAPESEQPIYIPQQQNNQAKNIPPQGAMPQPVMHEKRPVKKLEVIGVIVVLWGGVILVLDKFLPAESRFLFSAVLMLAGGSAALLCRHKRLAFGQNEKRVYWLAQIALCESSMAAFLGIVQYFFCKAMYKTKVATSFMVQQALVFFVAALIAAGMSLILMLANRKKADADQTSEKKTDRAVLILSVLGTLAGVVMQLLAIGDFIPYRSTKAVFLAGIILMLTGSLIASACGEKENSAHRTESRFHKISKALLCDSMTAAYLGVVYWKCTLVYLRWATIASFHSYLKASKAGAVTAGISLIVAMISLIMMIATRKKSM